MHNRPGFSALSLDEIRIQLTVDRDQLPGVRKNHGRAASIVQMDVYPKCFEYAPKLEGYPNWFIYETLSEIACSLIDITKQLGMYQV